MKKIIEYGDHSEEITLPTIDNLSDRMVEFEVVLKNILRLNYDWRRHDPKYRQCWVDEWSLWMNKAKELLGK